MKNVILISKVPTNLRNVHRVDVSKLKVILKGDDDD